ncbi:MAG: RluA family pseudouridine synthase [Parvularculales bacterium]
MTGVAHHTVLLEEAGQRLDRWFRRHYPALPHGAVEKLLRRGQVRLDGARVRANARLEEGQVIRIPPLENTDTNTGARQGAPLSEANKDFVRSLVLYQDDNIIALNKPCGLAVQGGSGLTRHLDGLLDGLCFDKPERPRLVHRLDKDTSGVLLLARTLPAATHLGRVLKAGQVKKLYWGLTLSLPHPERGVIDQALMKRSQGSPDSQGYEMIYPEPCHNKGAKKAVTRYVTLATAGRRFAWVAFQPVTGRTHQIRVHAASLGMPIAGDRKYGNPSESLGGLPDVMHLHARALSVPQLDGGRLEIVAPLPPHMTTSWEMLGFEIREGEGDIDALFEEGAR